MKKLFAILLALTVAGPAFAAQNTFTVGGEHTDYTNGWGHRSVGTAELTSKFDKATIVTTGSYGQRVGGGESIEGQKLGAQLYVDWASWLYTRTAASFGTNDPVFARKDFAQDVNFKLPTKTTLLVGGRYAEYFGGVNVASASVGITQALGDQFSTSYRFTRYDSNKTGQSDGHLVTLKLKDTTGFGSTQLWLGQSDSLYAYDWLPTTGEGKQKSAVLRRVQPLAKDMAVNLTYGKTWYETPAGDYQGKQAGLSFNYMW